MNRIWIMVLCCVWFGFACSGDYDDTHFIDYAGLNIIDVELDLEISESEQFIPGRLNDLVVFPDGTMLVSDQTRVVIEHFTAEGEYVGIVASEGGGPGELPGSFSIMGFGLDTLLVIHQGGRKDYYVRGTDGTFAHTRGVIMEPGQRRISVAGRKSGAEYFAMSTDPGFTPSMTNDYDEYHNEFLVVTDERNHILRDSLHTFKTPSPYIQITRIDGEIRSMNMFSNPPFPYRSQDRFLVMEDGCYMVARVDSSAFFIYNSDDELEQSIHLNITPRPVERSDLERFDQSFRQLAPDVKPPFLDVWLSDEKIMLHTDSDEEDQEIVLLNFEGEILGKFLLPEMDDIRHFSEERIYTLHKDPDVGNSIRIYQLKL
ncbi:MAG: hypothetical protein WEA56_09750 [Balneolaceae bacterium]